jgi:hypothetical protein
MAPRAAGFFSNAALSAVVNDPGQVSGLYAAQRQSFIAALGSAFKNQPESHLKLAFAAVLSHELKPYGSSNVTALSSLLAGSALDNDGYALLAWQLFQKLMPAGNPDVVMVGWNGGAVGNHAQLLINTPGSKSLLVDPTIGHLAMISGVNGLLAGEAVGVEYQRSLYSNFDPNLDVLRDKVITALDDGLYRTSDLLYWYEKPTDAARFDAIPFWATPQGEVVRGGGQASSALGGMEAFDTINGGAGRDILVGDGIFVSRGTWMTATPGGNGWHVGDFNGDGKDDIFRIVPGQSGAEVFRSIGSDFRGGDSWTGAGSGSEGWYIGDFNGDGKDDIFRVLVGKSGADMFLSSGSSFQSTGSWTGAGSGSDGWHVGDFNGDGKDDIFRVMPGKSGAEVFLSTGSGFSSAGSWTGAGYGSDGWYVGDFNGDGKDDVFRVMAGKSGAEMFLSTGAGFQYAGSWSSAYHGGTDWVVLDINGDGRDDLIGNAWNVGAGSVVLASTGSSFRVTRDWTPVSDDAPWVFGDFTGDARADALRVTAGTQVFESVGLGQRDSDVFVLRAGQTDGDIIADFNAGDEIWFEGFGPSGSLAVSYLRDAWTISNPAAGTSETFRILGLSADQVGGMFFV